ncbi:terpene synthase family protein [Streptomyces sp. NPDC001840]
MPQDIDFHLPFELRTSPDVEGARTRSLIWARQQGIATSPLDEQRIRQWDIAELMAKWAPSAVGPSLDLTVDAVVACTVYDDQFDDRRLHSAEELDRAVADVLGVMRPGETWPERIPEAPLYRAFAHVWSRLASGATPDWQRRTARHFRWFMEAGAEESRDRPARKMLGTEQFIPLRRRSGLVYAMMDLSEKAYGFETSARAREMPELCRMLDITSDFITTANDVHSLEKEESRGDPYNYVLVVEHELDCGRREALRTITDLVGDWCREFTAIERRLLDACRAHDLTGQETEAVLRLCECMRSAMRGYDDWSRSTQRYARPVPPAEPAYSSLL